MFWQAQTAPASSSTIRSAVQRPPGDAQVHSFTHSSNMCLPLEEQQSGLHLMFHLNLKAKA